MSIRRPPTPAEATIAYASLAGCLCSSLLFYAAIESGVVQTLPQAALAFAVVVGTTVGIAPRLAAWWLGRSLETIGDGADPNVDTVQTRES